MNAMNDPLDEEKWIREAYQGYLSRELSRPEVFREKAAFIETYFSAEPSFVLEWGFSFSALALALLVTCFFHLETIFKPIEPQEIPFTAKMIAVEKPAPSVVRLPIEGPVQKRPQIEVKRASSQTGTVMVYQKVYNDMPFTIVWVFTPQKS